MKHLKMIVPHILRDFLLSVDFFFLPKFPNHLCLLIYDQDFEVFKFAQSWQNTTSGFQSKEEGSLESLLMPLDHNEIKLKNFFFISWVQMN